jgi:chromosome partitioning protein
LEQTVVQSVIVMNAKGGCGKTTVATNLASYLAARGRATALFDFDPQGSSSRWQRERSTHNACVHGVDAFRPPPPGKTRSWQMRPPEGTEFVVVDTPAGFSGYDFESRVAKADIILVPVLPSAIDIHSTADFIRDLLLLGKVRALNKQLGIIANRTKLRTESMHKLERFLETLGIPVVARIRDTQNYVRAAELGLGVHELDQRDAAQDIEPWAQLYEWLGGADLNRAMPGLPVPQISTSSW